MTFKITSRQLLLLLIFFVSGFAALLYQVVWQRWLVFYTGISALSISLIVSAFMAGIGLGYLAGGQIADKAKNHRPILYFILAEAGIGTFALLSKGIIYDWLYQSNTLQTSSTFQIYALLFLVLLFPTFLMGLSLPLLSKAFQLKNAENQANYISLLYFTNTLGAAIGACLTAFLLIRYLGFENSVKIGALLNFFCAISAIGIYVFEKRKNTEVVDNQNDNEIKFSWNSSFTYWILQYTLSGFMAICFEIVWFRMLETMMKSIAITFSIILSIYLFTMAVGTYFGVWFMRRYKGNRLKLFLNSQYLLYAYTIGSILLLFWGVKDTFLFDYFRSYELSFVPKISLFTLFLIPLFLMAVPTFLMGFSFTVSQLIIQDKFENVGRKVGWLQFMNIVGSTAGAWFVSLVGFNYLGTAMTIKVVGCLGLIYVFVLYKNKLGSTYKMGLLGILLLLLISFLPDNQHFWMRLSGVSQESKFILREDDTALSSIKIEDNDEAYVFINGLGQSMFPYSKDDTHIILGAVPTLLHPNPQSIAIVGLGSASTLYNAAGRPETNNITCFEVIVNQPDAVMEYVGRSKDSLAAQILNDKRTNLVLKDGRYALHRGQEKYDLIEADALRPKSSFSGNLYSVEYFELLKSKLKTGGYAVSWGPTDRVINGMKAVFPYVTRFDNFMIIGSEKPILVDKTAIQKRLEQQFTKNHYGKAGIKIGEITQKVLNNVEVLQTGQTTTSPIINRDMWPKDEYGLNKIWDNLGID